MPEQDRAAHRYRVGSHYGIHVYDGDRPVATFHDAAEAALFVGLAEALAASEAKVARVLALAERWAAAPSEKARWASAQVLRAALAHPEEPPVT